MTQPERDKIEQEEKEIEEAFIIKPLDGGYGWIVVLASFLANVIVDGVIFTVGAILLPAWISSFQTTDTAVSLTMSILSGSYLLVGPIASALCNLYGCRTVVIIGSLMSFFGFICSTIAPQVYVLYITFGFIGGVGFGLVYLPAIVVISQWFSEKRSLATGLAVCGSGIGTTVFAALNPLVMDFVGKNWRLFLVYIAIASLLPILSALAYKQVTLSKEQMKEATKIAEKELVSRTNSTGPGHLGDSHEPRPRLDSANLAKATVELNAQKSMQRTSSLSQHDIAEEVARESVRDLNRPLSKADAFYTGSTSNLSHKERARTTSGGEPRTRTNSTVSRHSRDSVSEKHQSNIHLSHVGLPAACEGATGANAERTWKTDLRDTLKNLLDPTLLGSPSFIILAFSGFLTMICFYVPFNYLGTMMARLPGITDGQKAMPIALIGAFNIVARIVCGWLSDQPAVDALMVSNICITIAGVATFMIPLFTDFWMYLVFCVPFSCGLACFAALRSIICVELFGLEKLSNAFGILLTFMGVGAVIGVPIAATVKDVTGSFDMSFYIMGAVMAISGAICFPLRRLRGWEERKALKKSTTADTQGNLELQPLTA